MEDMMRIAECFGIKPSYVYKTKYYYTVKCGRDEYRIIPALLTPRRLEELYNIRKSLFDAGLRVCDRLIPTPDKSLAVEGEEGSYIMTESVRGINPEFENSAQILSVFSALGSVHRVLRGVPAERCDLLSDYKKGAARLKSVKKQLGCAKKTVDTDIEYLRHYKDYHELACNAVSVLEGLSFGVTGPVHAAVKEDNIFVGRGIVFTDWEMSRPGHFAEDAAQLIKRYVRKFAYSASDYLTLDEILDVYTAENPLDDKELAILYALLMYPKRYISIVSKYYGKAHRFTPAGVKRKFEESYEQKDFYLNYIGL